MLGVQIPTNQLTKGNSANANDSVINGYFRDAINFYTSSKANKDTHIAWSKKQVADDFGMAV
jgi:V8-like Glu-specific endopeptidase